MKTISIFLALINSLLAGLLITFLISSDGLSTVRDVVVSGQNIGRPVRNHDRLAHFGR